MEFIKTLSNQNQLALNTVYKEKTTERSTRFSFRLVFGGQEHYTSGSRSLTLYPGHFLWLNEGISYSREVNSSEPVSSFSPGLKGNSSPAGIKHCQCADLSICQWQFVIV